VKPDEVQSLLGVKVSARPAFNLKINAGSDGTLPVLDLLLAALAPIAIATRSGVHQIRFLPASNASGDTFDTVWRAVRQKYFHAADCRKSKNARDVARELVIDILANKPKWSWYDREIAALLVDKTFVERLARGLERKRKPIFEPDEWIFLLNWHEWLFQRFGAFKEQNVLALKFWAREAICNLMDGFDGKPFDLSRLDSRLRRLALDKQSVKPAKIVSYIYRGGAHRIETA
jgi:hypothetical protein